MLCKFRITNHRLLVKLEGGKISKETIGNVSSMTQMTIGDEFHYILQCQYFEQNCKHLIPSYFRNTCRPNVLKFKNIMTVTKKSRHDGSSLFIKFELYKASFDKYMLEFSSKSFVNKKSLKNCFLLTLIKKNL